VRGRAGVHLDQLYELPSKMTLLDGAHPIERSHSALRQAFFLYLGRHIGLPVALQARSAEEDLAHPDRRLGRRDEAQAIALLDEARPSCASHRPEGHLRQGRLEHQETRARGRAIAIATTATRTSAPPTT
jgi:hypothetical protein